MAKLRPHELLASSDALLRKIDRNTKYPPVLDKILPFATRALGDTLSNEDGSDDCSEIPIDVAYGCGHDLINGTRVCHEESEDPFWITSEGQAVEFIVYGIIPHTGHNYLVWLLRGCGYPGCDCQP